MTALGKAADRELAGWVDLVWTTLRTRSNRLGYASAFSCRVDGLIWDVLEAELVTASDRYARTPHVVTIEFLSPVSAARVFFPERFVGICRHGETPFLRKYGTVARCGVSFSPESPFIVSYSHRKQKVTVKFEFVYVNQAGVQFFNEHDE